MKPSKEKLSLRKFLLPFLYKLLPQLVYLKSFFSSLGILYSYNKFKSVWPYSIITIYLFKESHNPSKQITVSQNKN